MIFYPDYPEIPSVLAKAELYTSPDSESLEVGFTAAYGDAKMLAKLQEFLSSAQPLGYVPKTYRICCNLVLTGDDGMTVTLGLDAESDLFVIDGVFYDYSPGYDEEGSVDSSRDLLGLLGFEEWP